MTKYTADSYALPYPEGTDRVALAADIQALAVRAAAAISLEGARLEATVIGARLALDVNLDALLTPGDYFIESDTYTDTARGFPVARGGRLRVEKFNASGTHLVQTYYPFRHPGFFVRYIYSSKPYVGTPYGSTNNGWQEFRNWAEVEAAISRKTDGAAQRLRSDPQQWAAIGDSLTDGYSNGVRWDRADSFPAKLQAALPSGVIVTNYGQSGATSDQINMLLGITAFRVRIAAGSIPASGSVAVTTEQAIGGWNDTQDLTFSGHMEGVYGSLKRAGGAWSFTRGAAGSAVPVARATFRAYYAAMPSLAGIADHSLIVGYGRNDISKQVRGMEPTIPDHVIRSYADAYEFMAPREKQFIFAGTITRTDETPDSNGFKMVQEIRSRLRQQFPANFVDLQDYLIGPDVWAHTGITPTGADLTAQSQGMTPPSLFDDVTHYNRATAKAIAENLYGPYIRRKGWA